MVVLRDGRVAGERRLAETTPEETILLIVGREPSQVFRRPAQREGEARLVLEALTVEGVGPVDCSHPRRRGRRPRRPARRRPGSDRPRALRPRCRSPADARCSTARRLRPSRRATRWPPASTWSAPTGAGESVMPNLSVRENLFLNPLAAGLGPFSSSRPAARSRRRASSVGRSASGRTIRASRSSFSPAATSRRWSSAAGCISPARSTSSRTRPPASTSAPRPRSTGSSTSRCSAAPRSSSSRPTSRRSPRSATARWSSTAAASWPSSAPTICRSRICLPRLRPAWDGWRHTWIVAKQAERDAVH